MTFCLLLSCLLLIAISSPQVLDQLHSSSLPDDKLSLLRPLHQRGAKETKKQRLRRALQLQRAGLGTIADAEDLLQERKVRGIAGAENGHGSSSSTSSSEEEDSDSEGQERPAKQARLVAEGEIAPAAAAVTHQQQQQKQEEEEDDSGQEDQEMQEAADEAAAAAAAKDQLAALKAQAAGLKAQARLEADGSARERVTGGPWMSGMGL